MATKTKRKPTNKKKTALKKTKKVNPWLIGVGAMAVVVVGLAVVYGAFARSYNRTNLYIKSGVNNYGSSYVKVCRYGGNKVDVAINKGGAFGIQAVKSNIVSSSGRQSTPVSIGRNGWIFYQHAPSTSAFTVNVRYSNQNHLEGFGLVKIGNSYYRATINNIPAC